MNLVTGEWIPVVCNDNGAKRVGLRQLFEEAEQIRDLTATPPQRIALMRMLLCITQAALDGPGDRPEWESCKPAIQPAALRYLKNQRHLFDLYGDNPFMQVPTLKHTFNATVDKLDFGLAAGNNATLYDHEANADGRGHDDGWIALMLISYLVCSPGGKIGVTKWGAGFTQPGKEKGPGESEHAPGVECSALHTYIRAKNLLDTLHANLLSKAQVADIPNLGLGNPTWELDRSCRDRTGLKDSTMTYLGRLLPLTRAIRLEKENPKLTLANGIEYPKFPECREVAATVVERKEGKFTYVPTSLDRHPWRELNALLSHGSQNGAFALGNLDRSYEVLLDTVNDGSPFADKWVPLLQKAVNQAFENTCPHTTPRQIQAFARGKAKLNLKKLNDA